MSRANGVQPGAWEWIGDRHPWSARTRRVYLVVVATVISAILLLLFVAAAVFVIGGGLQDPPMVTVTNGCGFEIYIDDGEDGTRMAVGQSTQWGGLSESGDKAFIVWRVTGPQFVRKFSDGERVNLHGDSTLSGPTCPS